MTYFDRQPQRVLDARKRYVAFDARVLAALSEEPQSVNTLVLSVASFPLPHGMRRKRYLSLALTRLRAAGKVEWRGKGRARVWLLTSPTRTSGEITS